ncbi:hypothetical protein [Streptomyces vinaceus]|uniref:hypothetical protein n=1 Tax=Streptomyces vinaceus TaxID=1960 RepID=UPI00369505DE
MEQLRLPDLIVCGHSHCAAVRCLVRRRPGPGMPLLHRWLPAAAGYRRSADELLAPGTLPLPTGPGDDQVADAARRHVVTPARPPADPPVGRAPGPVRVSAAARLVLHRRDRPDRGPGAGHAHRRGAVRSLSTAADRERTDTSGPRCPRPTTGGPAAATPPSSPSPGTT